MTEGRLRIVILAAGKGTRMESDVAKVLHPVAGAPMLTYLLRTASRLSSDRVVVVVGHQADAIRKAFRDQKGVDWVLQKAMKGTGDAVQAAAPKFSGFRGSVLVLYGDAPGVKVETLRRLAMVHSSSNNAVTLLTADLENPTGYGRIVQNADGSVARIVEEKEATEEEKEIQEINSGIGIWESDFLFPALKLLKPDNRQKEYYLTDLVGIAREQKKTVGRMRVREPAEVLGVNSREDLADVARVFFDEKALELLKAGVTMEDPASTSVEPFVTVGKDSWIDAGVRICGGSVLGNGVRVGLGCRIEACEVQDGVELKERVSIQGAKIGAGTSIGAMTTVGRVE